ncbi:MAG: DUF1549 and DUF1553 domain-containing protein [Gemmataceae bacterium]|nr:DUF1549 and DUF1553 domain-containing protein [Gemmataceae bacterium]
MPRLPACLALLVFAAATPGQPPGHWAWKTPVRPPVPRLATAQPANPIDAFIRAKLAAAELTPAAPATREQLIRRVTFDLTGLPPTPEEVQAFVADKSPDAWEKVVDRLLASPHYGERWGRHWLDLARYADTNGYEFDEPRPDAWRYRDYVIASFNADKPFDRFVLEQLAGDEAFPDDPAARVATGFNLLGPDMTDASDQAQRRLNTLTDMTDTTGLVFLGLTITCARCHDHKFEPISQTDYYRLQAFFAPAAFRRDLPVATAAERAKHDAAAKEYAALTKPVRDDIAAIEAPPRRRLFEAKLAKLSIEAQEAHRTPPEKRTGGQLEQVAQTERLVTVTDAEVAKALPADDRAKLDELQKRLKAFDVKKPTPPAVAMGLTDDPGPPAKWFVLDRGELANRGAEVQPGFPTVLTGGDKPATIMPLKASTGRRLALAKWVASPDNPLTARVIVNRLWQHHFGRGIVRTASDFGTRGDPPTHPELLDWLACELVSPTWRAEGRQAPGEWSLKRLHHLMLLSETYQQTAFAPPEALAKDPDNRLFSRMNRLRLDGEAVRDSLLVVSGRLNPKAGGPGVVLPEAAKASGGARPVPVTADPAEYTRRSVYLFSRRNLRHPFLEAFDLPDSNLSCPKRERSTTAPQALALLNSTEAYTAAMALSERLTKEATTDAERINRAYRLVLGRAPSAKEQDRAAAFLRQSPLSELCRALFNLNEFVYLD